MPPHIRSQATVDQGLFLTDLGILDREIAEMCGVANKTVRRWRRLYQRRGVTRGANGSTCPGCQDRMLDAADYALLLGAYLGDGHIVRDKRGVYLLSLSQDARYGALIDEWRSAVLAVKGGGSCHINSKPRCIAILGYWMHWPCLLPQHGAGRKHERPSRWSHGSERSSRLTRGRCCAGSCASDGCRITNWTVASSIDPQVMPRARRDPTLARVRQQPAVPVAPGAEQGEIRRCGACPTRRRRESVRRRC